MYIYTKNRYLYLFAFSGGKDTTHLLKMYASLGVIYRILFIHIDHSVRYNSSYEAFCMYMTIYCYYGGTFVIKKIKGVNYNQMHIARLSHIYDVAYCNMINIILFGHNYSDLLEGFYIRLQNDSKMYGLFSFDFINYVYINGFRVMLFKPMIREKISHSCISVLPIVDDYTNYHNNIRFYYRENIQDIHKFDVLANACRYFFNSLNINYQLTNFMLVVRFNFLYSNYNHIKRYIQYMRFSLLFLRKIENYMRGLHVLINDIDGCTNVMLIPDLLHCRLFSVVNNYVYMLYISDIHVVYFYSTRCLQSLKIKINKHRTIHDKNYLNDSRAQSIVTSIMYKNMIFSFDLCFQNKYICILDNLIIVYGFSVFI